MSSRSRLQCSDDLSCTGVSCYAADEGLACQQEKQESDDQKSMQILIDASDMEYSYRHHHNQLLPAPVITPSYEKSTRKILLPLDSSLTLKECETPSICPSCKEIANTLEQSPPSNSSSTESSESSPPISSSSLLSTTLALSRHSISCIPLERKREMIITLGQALINYGSPSYRVEDGLQMTAAKLDLKMAFTFTPESMMMTSIETPTTPAANTKSQQPNQHRYRHFDIKQKLPCQKRKGKKRKPSIAISTNKISKRESISNHRKTERRSHSSSTATTATSTTSNSSDNSIPKKRNRHNNRRTADAGYTDDLLQRQSQPWIILLKASVSPDNAKIGQITRLMHRFYTDDPTLSFDSCLYQLKHDITAAPPTCGPWTLVLSFTSCAFSACIIMFKGSWINSGFSALFGLVIGTLMVMSSHMPVYARVFEISTCAALSFAVRYLHEYCCFKATVLPPIVILLPGFAMTMAVMEITSKHIVVGTIRLVYAVLYSFLLAYGLELGSYLYDVFHPNASPDGYCPGTSDPTASVLPPKWAFIPLFPIMTCGISMAFGSSPRQWISATLCGALGFSATFFLSPIVTDSDILNAISAFLVGLYAHLALKMTGEPPISPLSVGLTLLVPGSIGVEGAYTLLHQKDLVKFNFALKMLNIAMGLSVGLFASGMVVYPFGKRRSLYISL